MATHSSTLAWRIPWTEEPGRLQSMGSRRVGHDWSNLAVAAEVFQWTWNCQSFSYVLPFVTLWTVACQPLLSREDRQEYWSGLPLPSPEDLPDPGIEPRSPALQADSLPSEPPRKHFIRTHISFKKGFRELKLINFCIISPFWCVNILENERVYLGAYRNHVVSHLFKETLLCVNLLEKQCNLKKKFCIQLGNKIYIKFYMQMYLAGINIYNILPLYQPLLISNSLLCLQRRCYLLQVM